MPKDKLEERVEADIEIPNDKLLVPTEVSEGTWLLELAKDRLSEKP